MNRYLSSKEALDILSRLAPRVWCKKLLTQLIFEGGIRAYALGGDLVGRVPILVLLDDETIAPAEEERFWEAVRAKYPFRGLAPERGKSTSRGTLYPITGYRWHAEPGNDSAHELSFGYFYYADSLDWDAGTIRIESLFPNEVWRELFLEDDAIFSDGGVLAQPRFSWLEFEIELTHLSFERSAIEMLSGLEQPSRALATPGRVGRPRKWDWDGALAAVAALASKDPDGLPEGSGAQAKVERIMADWFVAQTGEAPAESELRLRAAKVLRAVEEGRK